MGKKDGETTFGGQISLQSGQRCSDISLNKLQAETNQAHVLQNLSETNLFELEST